MSKWVKLIEKKDFATIAFDLEYKALVMHIAALSIDPNDEVYLLKKAQIAYLKADKAHTRILSKYANFADVFPPKLVIKLFEYMEINDYAIELVHDWQPLYGLIYNLGPIELEILKAYIKNNLANGFIRSFRSPIEALIFFDKKLDSSLRLCMDYQGFNNLTIKN